MPGTIQYQIIAVPLGAVGGDISNDAAARLVPWADPVRYKIPPGLVVALAASGAFYVQVLPANEDLSFMSKWYMPLSEPVRIKPGITSADQPFFQFEPEPEIFQEIPWFAPLSIPVRVKPDLGAPRQQAYFAEPFGQTQPESVSIDKWLYPWSEPVRESKRRNVLNAQFQQAFTISPVALTLKENILESEWHQPWSEPSVKTKKGLGPYLHPFIVQDPNFLPSTGTRLQGILWWTDPVRLPVGLKTHLQSFLFQPPRILPPVNVTMTLAATEVNTDIAIFAINVTTSTSVPSGAGVRVSITEVKTGAQGPASIRES